MMDDDLSVFFDTDMFADSCLLQRPGQPDVPFSGIKGVVDQEALQNYAVSGEHQLLYPTAAVALVEGDLLLIKDQAWRVRRDPRRVEDGSVSLVLLSPVGA